MDNLWGKIIGCTNDSFGLRLSVTEYSGDTEITQFDHALLCEEDVLGLQVSVQYLSVMDVLQRKTYLSKPVENVILAPILQFPTCLVPYLILFLDFTLQVTAVCKVHDNAQFAFFRFVDLLEPDNVWML